MYIVSILVLLDVGLEVHPHILPETPFWEFQSLFCWMLVWKSLKNSVRCLILSVSILVLLDVGLEDGPCESKCSPKLLFQSLFCWMLVWKSYAATQVRCNYLCFNPCFAGCWSGSNYYQCQECCKSEFQSLFCWMLVWKWAM